MEQIILAEIHIISGLVDSVKVISGPFIDFTGNVEEVNDEKQKVKVVVSIFGRPTSVELDCFQIESQK